MSLVLKPFQIEDVRQIQKFGGRALIANDMGLGKEQPIDALILTPKGWITMAEVGLDQLVAGVDGRFYPVTGIYPQGEKDVYRVHFSDGSWADCGNEHLWEVNTPTRKMRGQEGHIKMTKFLATDLYDGAGNAKWFIPVADAVQYPKRRTNIHPYLMGYLIANGGLTQVTPTVSMPDDDTVQRVNSLLPVTCKLNFISGIDWRIIGRKKGTNDLTTYLQNMGLMGHGAGSKFIPDIYRFNSINNRIQFLQGYLDGDGWVSNNVVGSSSASKTLTMQVKELVESLGGTARYNLKANTQYEYLGEICKGKPAHMLSMCLPNHIKPFQLERKLKELKPRTKYFPTRAITKIEFVGRKECKCISVRTAPRNLYVTNNHVVTHNTVEAIAWWIANKHCASPVVVVCPATVKFHWQDEFANHAGIRCDVLEGRTPRRRLPIMRAKVVIINYDIIQYWPKYIRMLKPGLFVIDECQNFRSPHRQLGRQDVQYNKRTQTGFKISRRVPHVLALGGTGALENRPAEMFAVLHMIDPKTFNSYFEFCHEFCDPQLKPWGWEFKGATNLGKLHKLLKKKVMIRRRKEDVLDDLPPRTRVVLPMRDMSLKEYKKIEEGLKKWARARELGHRRAKGEERVYAFEEMGRLLRSAAKLKLPSVIKWVKNYLEETNAKIILFGLHRSIIREMSSHFNDLAVTIDGSTKQSLRKTYIKRFNTDPQCKVFIGQIKAAGCGWSAKQCATTGTVEYWWNPATHTQADDRVYGMNRGHGKEPCFNYYFTAKDTVEEKLVRLLQKKQGQQDMVLDGKKVSDFDLFDKLLQEIVND